MKAAIPPRLAPPQGPPAAKDTQKLIRHIRRLFYAYLILLIFEGSLRKWALPQLSNPLLIIRDPVVILIYILAMRARCFSWNGYVISLGIIAVLSWIAGILVLLPYFPPTTVVLITGYGFRSNFLHLPLIFIVPAVFNLDDVKQIGRWTLLAMIPMAVLMALQFKAPPESFINRAAGLGEGQQIHTSGDKIRPPGTFSFISGAIFFLSTATAFLLHGALAKLEYKNWLLLASGLSLIIAVGVSGSRGAVLAVGLVAASLALILLVRPDAITKFGRNLLLVLIVAWAVSYVPVFRQGVGILSERFADATDSGESSIANAMITRTFGEFTEGLMHLNKPPLAGYGLGIGTNGGSQFLIGHSAFLLAENEWTRVLLESGPFLGLAFLAWRTMATIHIGRMAFRQLVLGNTLPIFLFSAGFIALLKGSFGQPTSVGFAVVLSALSLAAVKATDPSVPKSPNARAFRPRSRGRSVYATQMHADQPNGSTGVS